MKLPRHVCDNHAALAESQEALFTSVPEALATLVMVDGMSVDLCQECFDTVPLKIVLGNMTAADAAAKAG